MILQVNLVASSGSAPSSTRFAEEIPLTAPWGRTGKRTTLGWWCSHVSGADGLQVLPLAADFPSASDPAWYRLGKWVRITAAGAKFEHDYGGEKPPKFTPAAAPGGLGNSSGSESSSSSSSDGSSSSSSGLLVGRGVGVAGFKKKWGKNSAVPGWILKMNKKKHRP